MLRGHAGQEMKTWIGAVLSETMHRTVMPATWNLWMPLSPRRIFQMTKPVSKPSEISPIVFKEWHAKWADVPGPVV